MNNKLIILPFIIFFALACTLTAIGDDYENDARQRKIDYIYLEAARQSALENNASAFLLYDRLLCIDTANVYASLYLGDYKAQMAASQAEFDEGIKMMNKYFIAHPEDKHSSTYFGQVLVSQGKINEALDVWTTLDSIFPDDKEVKYFYSNTLLSSGDSANVVKALSIFETLAPEYGEEWHTISKLKAYLTLKDTAEALNQTAQMVRHAGNNARALITAGNVYQALEQPDSTLALYRRACLADSTDGFASYTLASYYLSTGDSLAYDREVFNSLSKNSLEVEIKEEILRNYISTIFNSPECQPKIIALFDTLVDMHPHEGNIHFFYSQYLAYLKEYVKAAEQISYAVDMDPANAYLKYNQIAYNTFADSVKKAVSLIDDAVTNFPDDPDIAYISSIALMQDKQLEPAIDFANRAIKILTADPKSDMKQISTIYSQIGDIYQQMEQVDSITKYYDTALQYNPDNLLALNNYAYALACNGGDLDKAEKMSAITVQREPENTTSLDTYAWIFFMKHEYKLAKEYIDKVLMLDTDASSAEIFHHAGDIYFMAGEPEQALDFWEKALKLDPDNELLKKKVNHKTYFYK
ncbi:MAG: tetratricopeptide repeat protein [Muribaculaceae bacterium]